MVAKIKRLTVGFGITGWVRVEAFACIISLRLLVVLLTTPKQKSYQYNKTPT
jgi:hypothetical protein